MLEAIQLLFRGYVLDLAVLFIPSTPMRLGHLCWRTPEYSIFGGGVDRTATWPAPKQDAITLSTLYGDIFLSFPIGYDKYSYRKNIMVISKIDWKDIYFVILFSSSWQSDWVLFFTIQTLIALFTPEYSKVPSLACYRWLFWRTPCTLILLNQVRPKSDLCNELICLKNVVSFMFQLRKCRNINCFRIYH